MKISRSNLAVSWAALACAGVIGVVAGVALVGQQQPADRGDTIVRSVSDEGGVEAAPSAEASPTATASASAAATADTGPGAATDPAPQGTSTTTTRSTTMTDPAPTTEPAPTTDPAPAEPTPEPPAPPANSGGESGPPVGNRLPTGPTEYPCQPQEYGINPRCPLPAPSS